MVLKDCQELDLNPQQELHHSTTPPTQVSPCLTYLDKALTQLQLVDSSSSLLLQQPMSNALLHFSFQGGLLHSISTLPEDGQPKPEFKSFNHSLDDAFCLVRAGNTHLFIIDITKMVVDEMINDFWLYKGSPTNPVCAAATRDAERILATSLIDNQKQALIYYKSEQGQARVNSNVLEEVIPGMNVCSCMESSSMANNIVIGGLSGQTASFSLIDVTNSARFVNKLNVPGSFGRPFKIKRIPGQEYYISACIRHIIVLKQQNNILSHIQTYKDVHSDYIFDIHFASSMIFSKGRKEDTFKVTFLGEPQKNDRRSSPDPKPQIRVTPPKEPAPEPFKSNLTTSNPTQNDDKLLLPSSRIIS